MEKTIYSKKSIILVVTILLIGMFYNPIVDFLVNVLWFQSVNYFSTFWIIITTKAMLFVPLMLIIGLLIYFYIDALSKNYVRYFGDEFGGKIKHRKKKLGAGALLIGSLFSFSISNYIWKDVLMFLNAEEFGRVDPIFGHDIGFYVFKFPLIKSFLSTLIFILFWMMLFTIIYFSIIYKKKKIRKEKVIDLDEYNKKMSIKKIFDSHSYRSLIRALTIFAVAIMVLVGINYYLLTYKLLYSSLGVIYGAGYTDVKVTLLVYRMLSVLSLVAAGVIVYGYKKGRFKVAISGPITIVGIHIIGLIVALVVQQLVVLPDEIRKESPYIQSNIEMTQNAYGINDVDFIDFVPDETLDYEELMAEEDIINNIMINDDRPLKQTFNEIQGIRSYYVFNDIDVDRYTINNEYRQMFIAPREMDSSRLGADSNTWINKHFKYTHGFGMAMAPVSTVNDDGQPTLVVKNIPPENDLGLTIEEPRIYFGESTNDYIIVKAAEPEFDYPSGSDNVEVMYSGSAGVSMNGLNRLLFALDNGSIKLLFSNNVKSDSRIVFNRNIIKRLNTIAPFLTYDADPYLVFNEKDGKLYWIVDAYTTTMNYPYSRPYNFNNKKVNYINNSVKVVVDAYNGDVTYYKYAEEPMINTFEKIFPDLLTDKEDMPEGLKGHTRYPQDFFDLQSSLYQEYHVDNPEVFYNGEDVWQIAKEKYMDVGGSSQMASKYVTFKLPDSETVEFLLTVPFTPNEKSNMTSLFIARSDHKNYGELFVYKFPKNEVVKGPLQVENQIDQDSVISPQFSLWSQQGSSVLRGSIVIVPINNSLLYVEPIYLEADSESSLPEMKRVILFYNDRIVMEANLQKAIEVLFDKREPDEPTVTDNQDMSQQQMQLLNEINALLEQQKRDIERLEELINQFNNLN